MNDRAVRTRRPWSAARLRVAGAVTGASALCCIGIGAPAPAPASASAPPTAPVVVTATQVAAGGFQTCARTATGGAQCWGDNRRGQLGGAALGSSPSPGHVVGLMSGVVAVAAGADHSCALTTAGGVLCWGANSAGQLGNGDISGTDSSVPVGVVGLTSGVVAITAGANHTCALTSGGGAQCWGDNVSGDLGNGSSSVAFIPVAVTGLASGVAAIDAGASHTCALTTAGAVKCWGRGSSGQLGDGSGSDSSVPVGVSGLTSGVAAISLGSNHTCALTTAGGVKCWGTNIEGELGDGTNSSHKTPVFAIGLTSGVAHLDAGGFHTCAVTTAGGAKCWGNGADGELGNGISGSENSPSDVSGLSSGVLAIVGGDFHTCAIVSGGSVRCWGYDGFGGVGDGDPTFANKFVPVPVTLAPPVVASIGTATFHEGDSGTHVIDFAVTLSNPSTRNVTIGYSIARAAGDTATANVDFVAATGSIALNQTFGDKTPTVAFIPVTIKGDTVVEGNETFTVTLTSASGAVLGRTVSRATIINDDAGSGVRATVSNAAIVEGDTVATVGGSNTVKFHLSLSKPVASGHTVTLKYTVTGVTATGGTSAAAGIDFIKQPTPITVKFTAGQNDKTVSVKTFADGTVEPDETFNVTITSAIGATIETKTGVGTIRNDD